MSTGSRFALWEPVSASQNYTRSLRENTALHISLAGTRSFLYSLVIFRRLSLMVPERKSSAIRGKLDSIRLLNRYVFP